MIGQPILHYPEGSNSEHHVAIEVWLPRDQVAHHVRSDHLLVNRVGLDVFKVEVEARRWSAKAFQRLDHAAGSGRRGDLGGREVAHR